jgi:hypothetical protein
LADVLSCPNLSWPLRRRLLFCRPERLAVALRAIGIVPRSHDCLSRMERFNDSAAIVDRATLRVNTV